MAYVTGVTQKKAAELHVEETYKRSFAKVQQLLGPEVSWNSYVKSAFNKLKPGSHKQTSNHIINVASQETASVDTNSLRKPDIDCPIFRPRCLSRVSSVKNTHTVSLMVSDMSDHSDIETGSPLLEETGITRIE